MKMKTLALAATGTLLAAGAANADIVWSQTIGDLTFNVDLATGADSDFLANNGYHSATVSVSGIAEGTPTVGLLGTGEGSWTAATNDGSSFFNFADSVFVQPDSVIAPNDAIANAADPDGTLGALWDSGFSGLSGWALHAQIGSDAFTTNGGGANEFDVTGTLINGSPEGAAAPGDDIDLFTVTYNADTAAYGSFIFALVPPDARGDAGGGEYLVNWAVPAPGALALLGIAGLAGTRRRRA